MNKTKMTTIFAFLLACLMVENTLFLQSYLKFGMFSIYTMIGLGGTIFFFVGLNLIFLRLIERLEEYKQEAKEVQFQGG